MAVDGLVFCRERRLKMIAKTSFLLLAGVAVCVVALDAPPASACDVDGIHAAASAQSRQAFSVAGTGSGMSSSVVAAGATLLTSPNSVIANEYGLPSGVGAREVASPESVERSSRREGPLGEVIVGKIGIVGVPFDDVAVGASSSWSRYVLLIDTTSSSHILLRPAFLTPKSD
jgi:hypothetical protein